MQGSQDYAVLWDMDGVLVDTGEFHFKAWKKTFDELGLAFSKDEFRETFGMNNARILETIYGRKPKAEEVARISDKKESLFRDSIKGKVKPLPGVLDWLKQFQEWGFKQAITSSAPPMNIKALMDELKIQGFFDETISGANLPGKPEPDVFLAASNAVRVPPNHCIVMEDSVAGVEGALRAGMKCIAVTTTHPADKLSEAEYVVDDLSAFSVKELCALIGWVPERTVKES